MLPRNATLQKLDLGLGAHLSGAGGAERQKEPRLELHRRPRCSLRLCFEQSRRDPDGERRFGAEAVLAAAMKQNTALMDLGALRAIAG